MCHTCVVLCCVKTVTNNSCCRRKLKCCSCSGSSIMALEDDSSCLASTVLTETASFGNLSAQRRCLCCASSYLVSCGGFFHKGLAVTWLCVAGREILELITNQLSIVEQVTLSGVRFSLHATLFLSNAALDSHAGLTTVASTLRCVCRLTKSCAQSSGRPSCIALT